MPLGSSSAAPVISPGPSRCNTLRRGGASVETADAGRTTISMHPELRTQAIERSLNRPCCASVPIVRGHRGIFRRAAPR